MFYIINNEYMFFSHIEENSPIFSCYSDDCHVFVSEMQAVYFSNLIDRLGFENKIIKM